MRILITGANGFIGGYITAHLLHEGHAVTCCVRDVKKNISRFPLAKTISCDFNKDTDMETWIPRLKEIDVLINCAGILNSTRSQDIDKIHYQTPWALFKACEHLKISRVIQISALGIADGPDNKYVNSKKKLDDTLLQMPLSKIILRPSLIYANGAYGGSALMRALAALPFRILLPGSGKSRFQPVAIFDLVKLISFFLSSKTEGIVNIVSEKPVSLKVILIAFRQWLGFKPVKTYKIPLTLIRFASKLGDFFSKGPMNSISYEMMQHENIADYKPLKKLIDFKITPFPEGLNFFPSQTADRWQARLYFLRPLLKLSLALLWIISGIMPLVLSYSYSQANSLLAAMGFPSRFIPSITLITCLWDILLGLALLFSLKNKLLPILQIITILIYTLTATIALSNLWWHPLAPLLKNVPILVAILILMAIEDLR